MSQKTWFDNVLKKQTLIIISRLASKITIPTVPLFFRYPDRYRDEKAAWERNHPLGPAN